METKFQTSFIPKKPTLPPVGMHPQVSHAGEGFASIYLILSSIILILSLAGVGYAYWHKDTILKDRATQDADLTNYQNQFNSGGPDLPKVQNLSTKIGFAQNLLNNHLAVSGVFDHLSRFTIESVRFMSLDLTTPKKPGETIKINMQGYGLGLQTVAFQSDVLNALDHYHLTGVIQNPVMSDPSSDAKSRVTFGFTAEIDPSSLKYKDTVATGDILTNAPPSNSAAPATPAAPQVDQSTPFGR